MGPSLMICAQFLLSLKFFKNEVKLGLSFHVKEEFLWDCYEQNFYWVNFTVAPCINNIKHFIVQLMHTNYKILRLLE